MKMSYIIKMAIALIFCFSGVSVADERKHESGKWHPGKPQYSKSDPHYKGRPAKSQYSQGDRDYKGRPDYHRHDGYRERPYDKHRRYVQHDHKGRRYTYQGHWRSWDQWDRYARQRPDIHEHGTYYRESGHLMFRFCEPGTRNCIFFSIGR